RRQSCRRCTGRSVQQSDRAGPHRSILLLQPLLSPSWICCGYCKSRRKMDRKKPEGKSGLALSAFLLGEQRIEVLLERVVVDAIVELHAGLHGVDHVLLGAVATQRGIDVLGRLVHGKE